MQQVLIHWILLKKNGLANLKSDVDKLDIDKLKNARSGWSSLKSVLDKFDFDKLATVSVGLSDVVKNDVVRKTEYDELVKKVNAVPTSNLIKKADYDRKINEIEKKITDCNHGKYITTPELNESTLEDFAARLAQAKLATKDDIADFVKKIFWW